MTDIARLGLALDTRQFESAGKRATLTLEQIKSVAGQMDIQMNRTQGTMSTVSSLLGKLGAATGLAFGTREIIRYADEWKSLTGQLKLVEKSNQGVASTEAKLFDMAQRNRQGYGLTVGLYSRMARSTEQLGISQDRLLNVTETVSRAIVIGGQSAEQSSGALLQFGQALASGTLRGDELNSVMEQTPRLAQAIADGMGVARGQIRALAKDGQITTEQIITALESQSAVMEEEFKNIPLRVSDSLTILKNSVQRMIGEADKGLGVTGLISETIVTLATNIQTATNAALGLMAVFASRKAAAGVEALVSWGSTIKTNAVLARAHTLALAEDAAMEARAALASREDALSKVAMQKETLKAIELSRALAVAKLQEAQATLRAATVPLANLAPLGGAAVAAEGAKRATAAAQQTKQLRELATLGQQQRAVTLALAEAEGVATVAAGARATSIVAVNTALRATTLSATLATGATRLFSAALSLVGGPWGAALLAIAYAGMKVYEMFQKSKEAAAAHAAELKENAAAAVRAAKAFDDMAASLAGEVAAVTRQQEALKTGGLAALETERKRAALMAEMTKRWKDYQEGTAGAVDKNRDWATAVREGSRDAGVMLYSVQKLLKGNAQLEKSEEALKKSQEAATRAMEDRQAKTKESQDAIADIQVEIGKRLNLIDALDRGGDAYDQMTEKYALMTRIQAAQKTALPQEAAHVAALVRELDGLERQIQRVTTAREKDAAMRKATAEKLHADIAKEAEDAAKSAQDLVQRAKDDAKAAEADRAQRMLEPFKEFVRGSQQLLAGFWESLFTGGVKSFKDLFKQAYVLFAKFVAQVLALKLGQKLLGGADGKGLSASMAGLFGMAGKQQGGGGMSIPGIGAIPGMGKGAAVMGAGMGGGLAGIGGALAGGGVGYATGSKWKGAATGALSGAAAGAAFGPWGALIGGGIGAVGGFIGGILGGKKKKKQLRADRAAYQTEIDDTIASLKGGGDSPVAAALKDLNKSFEAMKAKAKSLKMDTTALAAAFGEAAAKIKKDFIDEIDAQLNELQGKGGLNAFNAIMKTYEQNLKDMAAAGGDASKVEELRRLQLEKLFKGLSDEDFAAIAGSLPEDIRSMAEEMRRLQKEAEDTTKVLTEEGKSIIANMSIREARLKGDEKQALIEEAAIQKQEELAKALNEGLNADQMARLAKILDEELAQALKELEAQAQAAADELARVRQDMDDELAIRKLAAEGKDTEANALREQLAREAELRKWKEDGATAEQQAALALLQIAEQVRAEAVAAAALAEARKGLDDELAVRALRAQGLDEEADALALQLAMEQQIADWRAKGASDEQLALLTKLQLMEREKQIADRLAAAIQAAADATKSMEDDLAVRALEAQGLDKEAARERQRLRHEAELNKAIEDKVTQATIDRLKVVQQMEDDALLASQQAADAGPGGAGGAATQRDPYGGVAGGAAVAANSGVTFHIEIHGNVTGTDAQDMARQLADQILPQLNRNLQSAFRRDQRLEGNGRAATQ